MTKKEYWNKYNSFDLCKIFSDDFDTWWDTEKYDWNYWGDLLCKYLYYKFDTWWDPDKFNWIYSKYLCYYIPDKFDIWWNPNKFNQYYYNYLMEYILNKINTWYITKTVDVIKLIKFINNLEWDYE